MLIMCLEIGRCSLISVLAGEIWSGGKIIDFSFSILKENDLNTAILCNSTVTYKIDRNIEYRGPKSLGISWVTETSFVLMWWLLIGSWIALGWEWLPRESIMWLEGWNFSPTPCPLGRGEGLKFEFTITGQWFHQSGLNNETSIKPPKNRFQTAFGLLNIQRILEGVTSERARKFPHISPYASHLLVHLYSL